MERGNETVVPGFILQRIFSQTEHEGIIFSIVLLVYLLSLLSNLLIVLLIYSDSHLLHTPMYFFLSHLSLADLGFTSSVIPITLCNLVSQDKITSYGECFSQMYFYVAFGNIDSLLLVAMAYDRYVAICRPLHYTALMNTKRCSLMVSSFWLLSFFQATLYTFLFSRLSFCASRELPDYFCDLFPVLELSCSDTTALKIMVMAEGTLDILGPCILIVVSYAHIFLTVVNAPSSSSKRKAFSTCGSHLTVVILFYGTVFWVYYLPASENKSLASLMYTSVTPMLNPFIYSLRNNDIKAALRRLVVRMRIYYSNWK